MDDKSLWKKELSFGRKSKKHAHTDESPATDEKPTSMWKKELSFKRKPKADAVERHADADLPVVEEPVAEEPEVTEEPVWKRAVSFAPKTSSHDQPVDAEPVVVEATAPSEDLSDSGPEPAEEQKVWKKEVSFSRKPEAEPVAEKPAADPPVAENEPVAAAAEEKVWKKEVSFSRTPDAEPVVDEEPVAEDEPVAYEEFVAEPEPVAIEEPVAEEQIGVEALASGEVEAPAEPWDAPPVMPPAPAAEPLAASVTDPLPSEVVHPPVAAADLPPIVGEDAPKVPFWKKELSLGGKKGDKPVKEGKQKAPKVKAERAPKTKEPKEPKQPKERKQKAPKVKAERGNAKGRLVGLKIGASQLAAARVSNNGSAELLQVAREPLAPGIIVGGELRDPDALSEALKDFFAKHGLPKKGVRLGIANNRIGVRTFEIAGIEDQKQLANAIRFRAQETLPIPIDEAVLDYQVLGEGVDEDGQPTKRVLLVVAYRELIDRYVDACKKAGISLVGIDLEAFALLRALQAPQEGVGTDATAALVVVAIGHERSTFAVSDGRVCEFTRVLEWGGSALNVAIARSVDAAPSEVEGTKRALSLMDEMVPDGITADQAKAAREAMRRAIQTFARELVSSLQYYQNQPGSLGIGEIVLTGGTAHLPGIAGELERLIGVHVRVGDPLARMKVSKKVGQPEQIGSLAVAIGLGIED
jgi:type IV pilus assembly protein PilM